MLHQHYTCLKYLFLLQYMSLLHTQVNDFSTTISTLLYLIGNGFLIFN